MATAIKAIPTLHGEDAIRFREKWKQTKEHFFQDRKGIEIKTPLL